MPNDWGFPIDSSICVDATYPHKFSESLENNGSCMSGPYRHGVIYWDEQFLGPYAHELKLLALGLSIVERSINEGRLCSLISMSSGVSGSAHSTCPPSCALTCTALVADVKLLSAGAIATKGLRSIPQHITPNSKPQKPTPPTCLL